MLKKKETILFIITSFGIYYLGYLQIDEIFIFYDLAQVFLYFIFVCTLIYAIIRVIKDKRPLPLFKKMYSLFFGLLLALSFFLLEYLIDTDGGKKVFQIGRAHV